MDAVEETWLRLSRSDVSDVVNLRAWLTTVTGRMALKAARRARQDQDHSELAPRTPRAKTLHTPTVREP
jgi:DNA-directed RNA polymerase specialized sigma24 family protein